VRVSTEHSFGHPRLKKKKKKKGGCTPRLEVDLLDEIRVYNIFFLVIMSL
jgi:hypothetical protein